MSVYDERRMEAMGKVVKGKRKEVVPGTTPAAKKDENKAKVYQLRIALMGSKPEIWRRILVTDNTTLARLHNIIQELLGWEDDHLHEFEMPSPDTMMPSRDERRVHLGDVGTKEGLKFLYTYDFGDEWRHEVTVEKILEEDARFTGKPVCIGGENAGPPEDSGGIYGYYEMLKAIKDKRHPEHEEIKEWLGDFDPTAFDIDLTNRILSKMR
jgi:hypothetical protein